ncbi:MAG TPA: TonB family protein, partial [Prolixibacteraceae bacterium]|nr:TonB family protein [Prolixibacteraceae bacterium]
PPPPPPPPPPPSSGDKVQKNTPESNLEEMFIVVEELPEYPGGEKALQFHIQEMTAKTAQANGIKGKALVEFVVNEEGNVADVLVKSQDNDDVAKAAVKIVSGLKQWKPGKQRGKPVPVRYALELKF